MSALACGALFVKREAQDGESEFALPFIEAWCSRVREVIVMLFATLIGLPLPLLPIQTLWMNLVTDGFPALALAVDPKSPDLMKQPPRRPDARLLDGGQPVWSPSRGRASEDRCVYRDGTHAIGACVQLQK